MGLHNYHGYRLGEPVFARLLAAASERGLIVQLAVLMEDKRTQHPLLQVAPVDLSPLPNLIKQNPKLRVGLLNSLQGPKAELLLRLAANEQVFFEIATQENVGGIGKLLEQIPARKIFFGSHAPLFYFESALLKLKESALDEPTKKAISSENAHRLLAWKD